VLWLAATEDGRTPGFIPGVFYGGSVARSGIVSALAFGEFGLSPFLSNLFIG